jgi:hypothetical protein
MEDGESGIAIIDFLSSILVFHVSEPERPQRQRHSEDAMKKEKGAERQAP